MTQRKSKTYECTKCHLRVTCLGVVVGHKCPSNLSKWVAQWKEITDDE